MSNKSWKERMRKHWKKELILLVVMLVLCISLVLDEYKYLQFLLSAGPTGKIVIVLSIIIILWWGPVDMILYIKERIDKYKREAAEEEEKTEEK